MLNTQSGNFQNFEFESLAGIVSNTWRTKIGRNQVYCEDHCRRSSHACSHAPGRRRGRAQPPLPWPEPWEREEKRRQHPGPPLSPSPARCTSPTIVTAPEPTHSTPRPRPNPSSTRARPSRPVSPVHVASMPCAGHLLGAPVPDATTYKSPRRSNERTHPYPSCLPDTLTSPRSL
jgi:hypothetical protein